MAPSFVAEPRMRIVVKIILFLAAVIGLLILTGAMLPETWSGRYEIVIDAPPERVAARLADLDHWKSWLVWPQQTGGPQRADDLRWKTSDPSTGVGASLGWGYAGRVELTGVADGHIEFALSDGAGSDTTGTIDLTAEPGGGTRVTWRSHARFDSFLHYQALIFDNWYGTVHSEQLVKLRRVIEAEGEPEPQDTEDQDG